MLCESCINIFQNIHTLVLKALESYKYFTETKLQHTNIPIEGSVNEENELKYIPPNEFEIVVVEAKQKEKQELNLKKDVFDDESLDTQIEKAKENSSESKLKTEILEIDKELKQSENLESNDNIIELTESQQKTRKSRKNICKIKKNDTAVKEIKIKRNILPKETKDKNLTKGKKGCYVCSFCCKFL